MKAVLQRVKEARVTVEKQVVGAIKQGLLVLLCVEAGDSEAEVELFATKIAKMRIFRDDDGKFNRSLQDVGGAAMVVSQFTLAATGGAAIDRAFPMPPDPTKPSQCTKKSAHAWKLMAYPCKPANSAP